MLGKDMLWDDVFMAVDELFLGWAFPQGQLSLFLDTNEFIGVLSPIGALYTEVLQVGQRCAAVFCILLALPL